MPRSLPRLRASARRAAEPAQSIAASPRSEIPLELGGWIHGAGRRSIGHLRGSDQVAAPELDAIDPDLQGGGIDEALEKIGEFGARDAAIRRDRRRVGEHPLQREMLRTSSATFMRQHRPSHALFSAGFRTIGTSIQVITSSNDGVSEVFPKPNRQRVNLTIQRIASLRCAPGEREAYLWDAAVSGVERMRAYPSGRKTYLVTYRSGGGGRKAPQRRLALGDVNSISLQCRIPGRGSGRSLLEATPAPRAMRPGVESAPC